MKCYFEFLTNIPKEVYTKDFVSLIRSAMRHIGAFCDDGPKSWISSFSSSWRCLASAHKDSLPSCPMCFCEAPGFKILSPRAWKR